MTDYLERLLDLQVPQNAQLSPSGRQVIYSTTLQLGHKTGDNVVSTIWLATTGVEDSARQLTSGLSNDVKPQWCPDEESIAFVSDRSRPGKSQAIYRLPIKGGEAFPLTPVANERQISDFGWSPDGKFVAYLSADEKTTKQKSKEEQKDDAHVYGEEWEFNRLRLLHVSTKNISTLVERQAHVTTFAWNDEGSAIAFTTQKTTEFESPFDGVVIESIGIAKKDITTIHRSKNPIGIFNNDFYWAGEKIYFFAGATPDVTTTGSVLYSISVSCDNDNGPWTREAGGQTDCALTMTKTKGKILLQSQIGLEDEIKDLDGNVLLREMTEFKAWHAITLSSGELFIAVVKSSVSTPMEMFTLERKNSTEEVHVQQVSTHGVSIEAQERSLTKVSVESADKKVTLEGLFIAPDREASGPLRTLVTIHGGPYSRSTASFSPMYGWSPYMLASGYAVLYVNYRGSSGRGNEFASYARAGMGTVDYEDVITLVQSCIDKGLIDSEQIVVGGWSQGGFLSYLSAVRNGTHGFGWIFQGAICGAGVTDWDSLCITSDLPRFEWESCGIAPWSASKEDLQNRHGSALWEMAEAADADRIPPILILHGELDERVPITQAWGFHRGCMKHKIPCKVVSYPREGHLFVERMHIMDMFKQVKMFCDLHLS